jgi:hypothetical protein
MVDPDTGEVDRETVFKVLRHHHVDLSPDPLEPGNTLMVKGNSTLSLPFDEWVKRKTTDLLKRRFGVPIHHFFRPEMMGPDTPEPPNNAKDEK